MIVHFLLGFITITLNASSLILLHSILIFLDINYSFRYKLLREETRESTRLGCLRMLYTNLLFSLVNDFRLFTQAMVYICLSPCVGQSAGTALDVKIWRCESYSLLTKSPLHIFTSKLEEWEFAQSRVFILVFVNLTNRGLYGLC